jgi:hypothetical protein
MKRTLLAFALVCPLYLNSTEPDELGTKLIAFEIPYNRLLRAYFGCPETGDIGPEVCLAHKREIRRGDWEKARKAAAKLFDLEESRRDER